MLRKISSLPLRAINKSLNPIRAYSSTSILSKLHLLPKSSIGSEPKMFTSPSVHSFSTRSYSSTLLERILEERFKQEENLSKEVDQLLNLFQLKKKPWIHDQYASLISGNPCAYYSDLKNVLLELNNINKLIQKSFDKLYSENIKSAANSLDLLKKMKLYNKENIEFLFSLDNYDSLDSILISFKIRQGLLSENDSFDTLSRNFEFIKRNSDAITGMGYFARATMKWPNIVKLLQDNEPQLFNDKAFISHLVFNHNKTLNISIDKNREIIQETLKLLNEDKEVISAVVKEIKSNSDQYPFIKNDIIPVLINLAKKSELPSQLEHLNIKMANLKP